MRRVVQSAARKLEVNPILSQADTFSSLTSRHHLASPSADAAAEIARYIAQMTAEMAGMAGAARLEMLAYFLNMARNEAELVCRLPLAHQDKGPA